MNVCPILEAKPKCSSKSAHSQSNPNKRVAVKHKDTTKMILELGFSMSLSDRRGFDKAHATFEKT